MVKILLFADLRDKFGRGELEMEAEGKTVKELKAELETMNNRISLDSVMVAVNEEFTGEDTTIKNGDIVALIPPVSGG
ncbi:molybdopterin converting factor subunit 1 [Heyndrickxia acidicola]|uniref:Molybdopterin synthase sulfur carrier subunit n=1 Tax=Heyndrickxia acidicola TaxID=209389 RepID=A0ABU6MEJ8_9BACI|nr:molybdopterin converting factor subunit 1 [Heyndrickxia acidicola]MED1202863.1 molybdopterin converting factor subunit 1 [Heyndrickxia acidicola]